MERKSRSPKEEKPTKANKLDSLPSGQIIPFDRFPNFHKWVTQCRLQQSGAKQAESKNSDKDDKYSYKKGRKNFDAKDVDKNKKKSTERPGTQESKCDVLEKINLSCDSRPRNEKTKTKSFDESSHLTDSVKSSAKKEKKRPHTVNVLQRMKTQSDSIRNKHFTGIVENKSVIIQQKPKKDNVRDNKLTAQKSRAHTAKVQSRPITPKTPQTPTGQSRPNTPIAQNKPTSPIATSRPNSPNILFKKHDYTTSRGDKKIQKIVEKVDGSCVFIKAAVESKNDRSLKENHANVHKKSHSPFKTLQRMRAFTDSARAKRVHGSSANEVENPDASDDEKNLLIRFKKIEEGSKANIDVSVVPNKPQSADGKLQNNTDSLNNFVDEMERSFINKNFVSTSVEDQKKHNFLEVPKLENVVPAKKPILKSKLERPQSANNALPQKVQCCTESYRNFVEEMERSYPRYNFGEVTKAEDQSMDNLSDKSKTGKNVPYKDKGDNETEILIRNTKLQRFNELNRKMSLVNDWIFENQPKKAKSLSSLKNTFDIGEDKINTSHTILREKIGQYVKVCVPDICGKKIIKSIEGKIDDLERIINEKLKIGYESTDLGNHFAMFKNVPDVFNPLDKKDVSEKSSGTIGKPSNRFISNAGLIKYMEEKIEAYEKKYSYNFCNEAFITNLQDKVDALQKCIPMILNNIEKPKCQDAQCFTSDSFLAKGTSNETQFKKVNEADLETSEVWEVALENLENKKSKNDSSKPQIVMPSLPGTNRPITAVEDAKRVLAQAQNLFNPPKVFRIQSAASLDNSKDKMVNNSANKKNFSLISTQKSLKMEEYKNFLKKYKMVKFDDSAKTPNLRTSKEEKKSPFFTIVNANATSSSQNKEFEEMCAERHAEVIENLQKRIEHFKNSSRISELRSKIDEIKSSITRVTNSAKKTTIESDNNNVNVICSVKNYLAESDSVMETSCEDLLKVSEDITNLDEEIKHCKTQLAFYQGISDGENVGKNGEPSKLATASEKNSRLTFTPRSKCGHRTQARPKSANAKYSKTAFGGITKIIKNLQTKMDRHDKFYQNCNEVASALTNQRVAALELNSPIYSSNDAVPNLRGSGKLLSCTNVDVRESDLISMKAIENLKVKVDSLTETCNVANIRELQNKLENMEKASSIVAHLDVIKTLQAKIEKLENTLEKQTSLVKTKDSTETLYSCSSSKTFTNKSSDSKNLFDAMPACTYCMAVTLDHKPNLINWDKS